MSVITDGLVAYFDPSNPASYPGYGSSFTSLVGSASGTLGGNYSYSSGNIRLVNTVDNYGPNQASYLSISPLSVATISIWFYQHSNSTEFRYLLDGRPSVSGSFLLNVELQYSRWKDATLYKNGGSAESIT